ncbi:MAG: hypothetical protein WAK93_09655 [Solirubrobacteraceae bacterium]
MPVLPGMDRRRGLTLSLAVALLLGAWMVSSAQGAPTAPTATIARSCGQLRVRHFFAPLPISASRTSCSRARRIIATWRRRTSECVPGQFRGSKVCYVEHWRCVASQSPDGTTIPVGCRYRRSRIRFKVPL